MAMVKAAMGAFSDYSYGSDKKGKGKQLPAGNTNSHRETCSGFFWSWLVGLQRMRG